MRGVGELVLLCLQKKGKSRCAGSDSWDFVEFSFIGLFKKNKIGLSLNSKPGGSEAGGLKILGGC